MAHDGHTPFYRKPGISAVCEILVIAQNIGLTKIIECLSGSGAAVGNEVFLPTEIRNLLLGEVRAPWGKGDTIVLTIKPSDSPRPGDAKWVAVGTDPKHEKCQRIQRPTVGQAADSLIANSRPIFSARVKKIVDEAVEAGLAKKEIKNDPAVKQALEEIQTALESRADDRIVVANAAFGRLKHRLNEWVAVRRSADLDVADAARLPAPLEPEPVETTTG